jgi:hypothetical protein
MSGIDATTSGNIFRKDYPMVIAQNRQHAVLIGVRLAYNPSGWIAGQVVARNSVSGYWDAYSNGASSGLGTAAGVLFHDLLDAPSGMAAAAQIIVKGELYQQKLIGLDSNAISNLGARSVTDGAGTQILMF